jgi:hypothetical protein
LLAIRNDKITVKWLLELGASLAKVNKAGNILGDICSNPQVLKMWKKPDCGFTCTVGLLVLSSVCKGYSKAMDRSIMKEKEFAFIVNNK